MGEKQISKRKVKCIVTSTGNVVSELELEKYAVPQSKQLEEGIKFAVQVLQPPHNLAALMGWLDLDVTHSSCIHTKVQDAFGIGWVLKDIEDETPVESDKAILSKFFKKVNEHEDITSVCKKVGLDWEACGNGYFEVARGATEDDKIKALYHINATQVRLTKDKQRWIQQIGERKVYFKPFGEKRILNSRTGNYNLTITKPEELANEIIQVKQYTYKSTYYGLPDWLPVLFQLYGEMKEREYNLDFFVNHGIPAYAVIIEGGELDPTMESTIKKYFETEVKANPHQTMIFSIPDGAKLKFEQLSVKEKDASFTVYRQENRDDILTAHHVPPYRASIVQKGALGGGVAEEVDRIYLDSVINPRQKEFAWVINELIIKEGFEINSTEFDFEDIDIRDKKTQAEIDVKYFSMGARTSNEILIAQGKEPYEGGDVYFVSSNLTPIGVVKGKLPPKKEDDEEEPKKVEEDEDAKATEKEYLNKS